MKMTLKGEKEIKGLLKELLWSSSSILRSQMKTAEMSLHILAAKSPKKYEGEERLLLIHFDSQSWFQPQTHHTQITDENRLLFWRQKLW